MRSGNIDDLAAAVNLKIVPTGANVVLLRPFDEGVYYKARREGSRNVACDVQLYIDLMSSKERGEEQAEYLLQERMPMLAAPLEDSSSEADFHRFLELRDRGEDAARGGRHEEACVAYEQAISMLGTVRDRDTARDRKRMELLQWLSAVEAGRSTGSRDYLELAESLVPAPEFALRMARSIGYNEGIVKFGMMLHYLLRARFSEREKDREQDVDGVQRLGLLDLVPGVVPPRVALEAIALPPVVARTEAAGDSSIF